MTPPVANLERVATVTPSIHSPPATGPSDGPILHLHRADDSRICFRSHDGQSRELFAIPAGELRSIFPEIRSYLTRDSYFSVNGFYTKGLRRSVAAPDLS